MHGLGDHEHVLLLDDLDDLGFQVFEDEFVCVVDVVVLAGDVEHVRGEDALDVGAVVHCLEDVLDDLEVLDFHCTVVFHAERSEVVHDVNVIGERNLGEDSGNSRF